jgi:hypothetical protein
MEIKWRRPRRREGIGVIEGYWYNELGSRMQIGVDSDGLVSGQYWTPVGQAKDAYRLIGLTAPTQGPDTVFGWTVYWSNLSSGDLRSQTAWMGQYHRASGFADEYIVAHWLLTQKTLPADDWRDTLIGTDTFRRQKLATDSVVIGPVHVPSHPRAAGA